MSCVANCTSRFTYISSLPAGSFWKFCPLSKGDGSGPQLRLQILTHFLQFLQVLSAQKRDLTGEVLQGFSEGKRRKETRIETKKQIRCHYLAVQGWHHSLYMGQKVMKENLQSKAAGV